MTITAIETAYSGCRFRSRLEARWAVFFDRAGVAWQYESQGFVIDGRPYLPDFLLPDSGTWVEVKGAEGELDHDLMEAAAEHLPGDGDGLRLLILGPIPEPPAEGDLGWLGLYRSTDPADEIVITAEWLGFGHYEDKGRLWWLGNVKETPLDCSDTAWLTPVIDPYEHNGASDAYRAARSARFEHGESGAPK